MHILYLELSVQPNLRLAVFFTKHCLLLLLVLHRSDAYSVSRWKKRKFCRNRKYSLHY